MQSIVVSQEILLERIAISDVSTLFAAIDQNRSDLVTWLPFVDQTKELLDSEKFIQRIIENRDQTFNEEYMIWHQGTFVGVIGFHNTDRVNEKTELGYWLIGEARGRGIISKCCVKMIEIGFEKMKLNRITIRCAVGNESSEKIAQKLRFTFEGVERSGERYHDTFFDMKQYSLLQKDFLANQART